MGDLNSVQYPVQKLTSWRWDTLHTNDATHSQGKIDWVLGKSTVQFARDADSQVLGTSGSDHHLLLSYLRRVG